MIFSTIPSLWRGSPRWRWAVIISVVLTLLAAIGDKFNTSTTQPPPLGQVVGQSPPPVPASSQPINVVPPKDQKVAARLAQFFKSASAAKNKAQEGESCEGIVEAAKHLQEGDRKEAQHQPQLDMIDEADRCQARLEISNGHWLEISTAGSAFAKENSIQAARMFIEAIGKLDTFDLSRSATIKQQWVEKAQALKATLAEFEKDLASLASLSLLYRPNDPQSVGTADEMNTTYKRIQNSTIRPKLEELSPSQKQAIDLASKISKELEESNQRLSALELAWQRYESDPMAVAITLAKMSAVDKERWDRGNNSHSVGIKAIESAIGSILPSVIDQQLASYRSTRNRNVADQIVGMETMAKKMAVALPADTLKNVEIVSNDIRESNRRLDRLVQAAQAWENRANSARDKAKEKEILDAVAAVVAKPGSIEINAFDAVAMTQEQSRAFAKLLVASFEISGKLPADKRPTGIPVFLDASALRDKNVIPIGDFLKEQIKAAGFVLSAQTSNAALQISVSDAMISQSGNDNATGQQKYVVSLKAKLILLYSGINIDLGTTTATSHAPDRRDAIEAAEKVIAETLIKVMLIKLGNELPKNN